MEHEIVHELIIWWYLPELTDSTYNDLSWSYCA